MFCFVVAVLLAAADPYTGGAPTASPAPAATATPAPVAGPLREIVYKIAQTDTASATATDYGGTAGGSDSGWDQGTLTIDVTQVLSGNLLAVRASEAWNDLGGKPYAATGYVAEDGTLSIVAGTYSAVMETVLPYISTGFIASHDMTVGTSWDLAGDSGKVHFTHHYAVTKIDGTDVTISIDGTMSGTGMGMFPSTEKDTVIYRPARLVPISGDFTIRTRSSNGEEDAVSSHNFHFQRISDTNDR
jgi:hypothetical protein